MKGWQIGRPKKRVRMGFPNSVVVVGGHQFERARRTHQLLDTFRSYINYLLYILDCSPHDSKWQVRLSLQTLSQVLIFPAGHEHSGCWPVQMDLSLLASTQRGGSKPTIFTCIYHKNQAWIFMVNVGKYAWIVWNKNSIAVSKFSPLLPVATDLRK